MSNIHEQRGKEFSQTKNEKEILRQSNSFSVVLEFFAITLKVNMSLN